MIVIWVQNYDKFRNVECYFPIVSRCIVTYWKISIISSYHVVHIISAHGRCPWADICTAYSRCKGAGCKSACIWAVGQRLTAKWCITIFEAWRAGAINREKDNLYHIQHDVCPAIVHIRFRMIFVCDVFLDFVYIWWPFLVWIRLPKKFHILLAKQKNCSRVPGFWANDYC